MLWCKDLRYHAAALGQAALIELVEHLPSTSLDDHQPGIPQDAQVVRYGRLRNVHLLRQFAHAERVAAAERHDLLSGLIGQSLGEQHGIAGFLHTSDYIEEYQYVKGAGFLLKFNPDYPGWRIPPNREILLRDDQSA